MIYQRIQKTMELTEKKSETIDMRLSVYQSVMNLLCDNEFPVQNEYVDGIITIVDLVSNYHEEGVKFCPEIILTDDFTNFQSLSANTVSFSESKENKEKAKEAFKQALKLCVPLAINGWVLYFILGNQIEYGLISAERKETSLPLKDQVFLHPEESQHFLYICNSGSSSVEIFSTKKNLLINLSLDNSSSSSDENITKLVEAIVSDIDDKKSLDMVSSFIGKTIKEALNIGHGNLIAVCKEDSFNDCLSSMSSGMKLDNPINIPQLLADDQFSNSNTTSVAIKSNISLVKSMINHDGISFFSTNGKLLGFHYIVDNSKATGVKSVGGARTKAFEALKLIPQIKARFFKSQDGNTKFE